MYALSHLASSEQLGELASHSSRAVRLAAVLALRRQGAPSVARFLNDPDSFIVAEAIRAINDEGIDAALPELAAYTARWSAAGAAPPNEMLFRRMINGCLRLGRPEEALTVVQLAANPALPLPYRLLALKTIVLFDTPPPIDPTLGIYRPLPTRDTAPLRQSIETTLRALFESSTGELAAAAIQAMSHFGMRLDDDSLIRRLRDGRQPVEVRQVALQQFFDEQRFDQKVLIKSLLVDEVPALRATATRAYVVAFPDEASEVIRNLLTLGDDSDFRTAYALLADVSNDELAAILVDQLDALTHGRLYRTVQLDLYEAAQTNSHPASAGKTRRGRKRVGTAGPIAG